MVWFCISLLSYSPVSWCTLPNVWSSSYRPMRSRPATCRILHFSLGLVRCCVWARGFVLSPCFFSRVTVLQEVLGPVLTSRNVLCYRWIAICPVLFGCCYPSWSCKRQQLRDFHASPGPTRGGCQDAYYALPVLVARGSCGGHMNRLDPARRCCAQVVPSPGRPLAATPHGRLHSPGMLRIPISRVSGCPGTLRPWS